MADLKKENEDLLESNAYLSKINEGLTAQVSEFETENEELKSSLTEALSLVGDYEPCETCGKMTLGDAVKELKALKESIKNAKGQAVSTPIPLGIKGCKYADNTAKSRSSLAVFGSAIFDKKDVAPYFSKKVDKKTKTVAELFGRDGKVDPSKVLALYDNWCDLGFIVKEDGTPIISTSAEVA